MLDFSGEPPFLLLLLRARLREFGGDAPGRDRGNLPQGRPDFSGRSFPEDSFSWRIQNEGVHGNILPLNPSLLSSARGVV